MATLNETPYENRETVPTERRRGGLLWPLIILLILLLLLWFVISRLVHHATNTSNSSSTTSSQTNSNQQQSYKAKFEAAVPADQRTIYFVADSANLQDQAAADAALTKIADFAKANPQAKIVVNGSVFDGQPGQQGQPLAQQRAQDIKQQLVAKGVNAANVSVTAVNTYQGNTDAAKADYARSVTIDAK